MLEELVVRNRSYRAFDESRPITARDMEELVSLACKVASGRNLQPLRYRIVTAPEERALMLANTRYAGALTIKLPPDDKKPTGFLIILTDKEAGSSETLAMTDVGIAAQTIMLGATERGFGGCILASFDPARLRADFAVPDRYVPRLVLALGTPAEEVRLVEAKDAKHLSYYRDGNNIHYVPKLTAKDVLL